MVIGKHFGIRFFWRFGNGARTLCCVIVCAALLLSHVSFAGDNHLYLHVSETPGDLEVARRLAEAGDADAQFDLGKRYTVGVGVPGDDTEAVRWYRLAADQGNANAQYALGWMYENGGGVPTSEPEGFFTTPLSDPPFTSWFSWLVSRS